MELPRRLSLAYNFPPNFEALISEFKEWGNSKQFNVNISRDRFRNQRIIYKNAKSISEAISAMEVFFQVIFDEECVEEYMGESVEDCLRRDMSKSGWSDIYCVYGRDKLDELRDSQKEPLIYSIWNL